MIPRKLKPCKTCNDPKYLFSHGNCLDCYNRLRIANKPQVTLTQTTDGGVAKPFRVIKKVSDHRLVALAKYRKARDEYFDQNPVCQYPGCDRVKITLHHAAGKTGELLTNKKYFRSLCLPHHRWAEINPYSAQKLNLSVKRLDK